MTALHFPLPRHTETPFVHIDTSLCLACWKCVEACPQQVLGQARLFRHQHVHVDRARLCKGCRKCVRTCPNQAIQPVQRVEGVAA